MRDDRVPDARAAGENEVEHAIGEPGVAQRGEEMRRREGDDLGGLPDDGVAECECRGELPGRDRDGEVPRRDCDDDAERLASREQERVPRVAGIRLAVGLERLPGVVPQDRDRPLRLADRLGERLALFPREIARDGFDAPLEPVGGSLQNGAPLRRGRLAPVRKRPRRGVDGFRRELGAGQAHPRDVLSGVRRVDVDDVLVACASAAVDQRREPRRRHGVPPGAV